MPRKGKKRSIRVWGCDMADGTRVNAGENGIVSVVVHGDKTVSVVDAFNNETIIEGTWVGYVPRQN